MEWKGPDRPGRLRQVLSVVFELGLNVTVLLIERNPPIKTASIKAYAEPFYDDALRRSRSELLDDLDRLLHERLDERGSFVRASKSKAPRVSGSLRGLSSKYMCEISAVDVPGLLCNVAATVALYGGNIEAFAHEPPADSAFKRTRCVTMFLGLGAQSRRKGVGLSLRHNWDTFEYHLRSLVGIVAVRRLFEADVKAMAATQRGGKRP